MTAAASSSMPLFFKEVSALDVGRHGALKLDRTGGYGFAAVANALPLGLSEVALAAQYFPVVLTGGPNPMPVAILGYQAGENLFVDDAGAWLDDTYVPAYVRAFPFVLIEPRGSDQLYLGIETTSTMLGDEGEPLFDQGQPAPLVTEALGFAMAYREDLKRATAFALALNEAGIVQDHEARLTFKSGGVARLDGFRVIDGAKFEALDDAIFLDWRRRGWLAALHAMPQSAARWGRIVNLANGRRAQGTAPDEGLPGGTNR